MAVSTDKYDEPIDLAYLFATGAINMGKKKHKSTIIMASLLFCGCSTTEKAVDAPPEKTHYTLTSGATEVHPSPLPRETPVFVEWHYSNGDLSKKRGFTGWDFNGDGRFEMVEVLGEDKSVQATVFDFDGDGKIDRKLAPSQEQSE